MADKQSWEEMVKRFVELNENIIRDVMTKHYIVYTHLEAFEGKLRNEEGEFKNWKKEK